MSPIELRQRSPLGAVYRSPLGTFGPGVGQEPPLLDLRIITDWAAGYYFVNFEPMSNITAPNWFSRQGFAAWGRVGATIELNFDSNIPGQGFHWSDLVGTTVKSRATGIEITIDGTLYGGRSAAPENMHLFPCALGGDSSIEIRQRIAASDEGWDVYLNYASGAPVTGDREEFNFVAEWTPWDPGVRGTLFFADGYGPELNLAELPYCGLPPGGAGNSKSRRFQLGGIDAQHEPKRADTAYYYAVGLSQYPLGSLTMEADCFRDYRVVGFVDPDTIYQALASTTGRNIEQGLPDRTVAFVDDGVVADTPCYFVHDPNPGTRGSPVIGGFPWYSVAPGAVVTVPWEIVRADAATQLFIAQSSNLPAGSTVIDWSARTAEITIPPTVEDLYRVTLSPRDPWFTGGGIGNAIQIWAKP